MSLKTVVKELGAIPLSFALGNEYANLGDALSPLMVSLVSGLPTIHAPQSSEKVRMAAVGTIAHGFQGGTVWIWGTGTSKYENPLEKVAEKRLFRASGAANFKVAATRGPVTRAILGGDSATSSAAFGDPVWLLPQFYRPQIKKKWKLGVIVHLSDLKDRTLQTGPRNEYARYFVPDELAGDVRIIHTVTDVTVDALKERLDEILSCERLVSTSLHGMVFAESYGIPCLYFSPRPGVSGVVEMDLMDENCMDLRIIDLYRGLGINKLPIFVQGRKKPTEWGVLMDVIDRTWNPVSFDTGPLIESFPLDVALVAPNPDQTIFDHPVIQSIPISRLKRKLAEKRVSLGRKLINRLSRVG